ncbi:MAG TPA: hypothetical protein VFS35_10450, partial [Terrimicrobiaceae bacterium]|nr:hypothetical protein [Terrimicrobiaceae bacterium]
ENLFQRPGLHIVDPDLAGGRRGVAGDRSKELAAWTKDNALRESARVRRRVEIDLLDKGAGLPVVDPDGVGISRTRTKAGNVELPIRTEDERVGTVEMSVVAREIRVVDEDA